MRSSSWCCNWMKCYCGWSLLNSASPPLAESESWTMRLADFVWHFHSFWRINLRENLNCSKLDGNRSHFHWKWRCSHFWMKERKASQCASLYAFWGLKDHCMNGCSVCTCAVSPQCEGGSVSSNVHPCQMTCYTVRICTSWHHCGPACDWKGHSCL